MTAPNLISAATITGKTALSALTTSTANIVTNSANSNTVLKINNIAVANYTASQITANVLINRSATTYQYGGNLAVPAYSTLVVLAKDSQIYLEEGDVIQANVSANTSATITSSYEIISS